MFDLFLEIYKVKHAVLNQGFAHALQRTLCMTSAMDVAQRPKHSREIALTMHTVAVKYDI